MTMTGNTILITGGGTGIGRALAESFHARGNHVIIAGRRKAVLDQVVQANPGMTALEFDAGDAQAIPAFAQRLRAEFPALNVVIHNAGIMQRETITQGSVDIAEATISTNLLGPIRLTAALMPQLLSVGKGAILTVSSGLAFLPMAATPTYSATKAAVHSYTESLRHQLRSTGLQVIELIPPYVQTELLGPEQARDPNAMPLADYIRETMAILTSEPAVKEVRVERVKPLRLAEVNGTYDALFAQRNGA